MASTALATGLLLWLVPPAAALSLDPRIPTTVERAQALLARELDPFYLRSVYVERAAGVDDNELRLVDLDGRAMLGTPEHLALLPHQELDVADAEVFALGEGQGVDGPERAFYEERLRRAPAERQARLVPRAFRLRGPSLVVLLHPWRLDGEPLELVAERSPERPDVAEVRLPEELRAGDWVSLSVWLPRVGGIARELTVRPAHGVAMETARTRARRRQGIHQTARFRLADAGSAVEIELPEGLPGDLRPRVEVWRWQPPSEAAP